MDIEDKLVDRFRHRLFYTSISGHHHSMSNILIIGDRPEDLSFLQKVASHPILAGEADADGWRITCIKSSNELKQVLSETAKKKEPLVFWDIDHKGAIDVGHPLSIGRIGQVLQENMKGPQKVFLLSDESLNKQSFMFNLAVFSHHICRQYDDPAPELTARTVMGVLNPRGFGIKNLLPEGQEIKSVRLKESQERGSLLNEIQKWLDDEKVNPQLVTLAVQATDEMLMNAIFDAPMEGASYYRRKEPRNKHFPLKEKEQVDFAYGQTADYMIISCRDRFGSLKKSLLFGSIRRDYEKLDYTPPEKDLGAGLGIYGILQGGLSLTFVAEPNISTEVILVIPKLKSMKAFRSASRAFYCII